MGGTQQIGRSTRLVALLAILLGLLTMHGLASTHHAGAAVAVQGQDSGVPAHPEHTSGLAGDVAAPDHHFTTAARQGLPALAPAVAAPGRPDCDGNCGTSTALLCVAVLAAAAAALAAARPGRCSTTRALLRARAPSAARGWPPRDIDPVAELCISRT